MSGIRKTVSVDKLAQWLFFMYWGMKPFYFFSSGGLQIADFFMLLSAVIILGSFKKFAIRKTDLLFVLFVVAVTIINSVYAIMYKDSMFIKSILYYGFNLIAIVLFVHFSVTIQFLKRIKQISMFNIIIQVVIWITGYGRMYGSSRYKGTFNDPNQFAFFILMMLFVIYLIEKRESSNNIYAVKENRAVFSWAYLLSLGLLILSASTGMIMGFAVFTWLLLFYEIKKKKFFLWMILVIGLIALIFTYLFFGSRFGVQMLYNLSKNNVYINRIIMKILSFFVKDNSMVFIEDRNISTILEYPMYCLIGAGEGNWNRFIIDGTIAKGEIHSTLLVLLFCYGVLPFGVLVTWIKKNIKGCPKYAYSVLIALLIESFTLANHRQSIFWIIIVLSGMCRVQEKREST